MHAILPIVLNDNMAASHSSSSSTTSSSDDNNDEARRLQEIEAQAVSQAKATADAAFRPSPSILNASSADVLLQQVDGPRLDDEDDGDYFFSKASVYVGRSIPVVAGGDLQVPIQVNTPGSVVEYAVELKSHDISFGITAERDEGVTIVKVRAGYISFLGCCCCRRSL